MAAERIDGADRPRYAVTLRSGLLAAIALVLVMTSCASGGRGPGASFPLRDAATLRDIGQRAIDDDGFEAIMSSAIDAGLVVKRSARYASNYAVGTAEAYWLTAEAVKSGVAIAVALVTPEALLIVGGLALVLGLESDAPLSMSAAGNVADTGIMEEARALVVAGSAMDVCAALDWLMANTSDNARKLKIKATQKAMGCRRSRWS